MMKKIILILCLFSLTSCFQNWENILIKKEKEIKKVEEENKINVSTWQIIEIDNKKIEVNENEIEKQLELEEEELKQRILEENKTAIIDETKKIEENNTWTWEISEIKNENETEIYERENLTSSDFFNSMQWSSIQKQELTEEYLNQMIWEDIDERIRKKMNEISREVNEYLKKEE